MFGFFLICRLSRSESAIRKSSQFFEGLLAPCLSFLVRNFSSAHRSAFSKLELRPGHWYRFWSARERISSESSQSAHWLSGLSVIFGAIPIQGLPKFHWRPSEAGPPPAQPATSRFSYFRAVASEGRLYPHLYGRTASESATSLPGFLGQRTQTVWISGPT